jgi:hypothetical protein
VVIRGHSCVLLDKIVKKSVQYHSTTTTVIEAKAKCRFCQKGALTVRPSWFRFHVGAISPATLPQLSKTQIIKSFIRFLNEGS